MPNELKKCEYIEKISRINHQASQTLESSGRYIKSMKQSQNGSLNLEKKSQYEYLIADLLEKHFIYLQETIIKSYGKVPTTPHIPPTLVNKVDKLINSSFAISDNHFTIVDIEGLKRLQILKKAVLLPKSISLPCKVKSSNDKYKFVTDIIMSPSNILGYSSYNYGYDSSNNNVNHNTLLHKIGQGLKQSIQKSNVINR